MSSTSLPAPILGLTIAFPPSALVFLMSDYRVETLLLSAPYFIEPLPLLSSGKLIQSCWNKFLIKVQLRLKLSFSTYLPKFRMLFFWLVDLWNFQVRRTFQAPHSERTRGRSLSTSTSLNCCRGRRVSPSWREPPELSWAMLSVWKSWREVQRWFLFSGRMPLSLFCLIRIHSSPKCVSP